MKSKSHPQIDRSLVVAALCAMILGGVVADAAAQRGSGRHHERGPGVPDVDVLAEAIDADAEQRAVLAEARLSWLDDRGPGRRAGHRVDRGETNPPLLQFLVDVSPAVDTSEMIALVDLLSDHAGPRARRGDRRGVERSPRGHHAGRDFSPGRQGRRSGEFGRHGGRGHRFGADETRPLDALDLSDEQREQVRILRATTHGSLRALRGSRAHGEPTEAEREAIERIRADHRERLGEILTEEQIAELESRRADRVRTFRAEAGARMAVRTDGQIEAWTAILDLDESQAARVRSTLEARNEARIARRVEAMEDGAAGPGARLDRDARGDERAAAHEEIASLLEPAQRELFARLAALRLEGRARQ